ncbi:integrase core domain-containing protein [Spirosoma sp.]|uniref:integrase core domain-containing protein n=1 Tax=unclassified Spirosoma TaxID=2621999 RepID=UPI001AD454E2|nr:transposase [Spirosoma sp.]
MKYEHLYLRAYTDGRHLHQGLTESFRFYNHDRKHQSLGYQTPAMWYEAGIGGEEKVQFWSFT